MNDNKERPAAARDPRSGRFVSTANDRESREGKFKTYAEMPVDIQGGDPGQLAYDTVPRYEPAGDELAQGGESRLRPRHPVLVGFDEHSRAAHHNQGARTRDSARLHGITGLVGHVLGVDDARGPYGPVSLPVPGRGQR